ncbi:hypothetical protein ACLB2K_064476 [Fragaria x ananassa]
MSAAKGFIIKNNLGNRLVAGSFNSGMSSIPIAEAVALRNSLLCAKDRGFRKVEVKGDSKLVIDAVNEDVYPP